MKQKRKPISLDELLSAKLDSKQIKKSQYNKIVSEMNNGDESEEELANKYGLKVGKYSLKTRIKNNPWTKSGRPASLAQKWLYQEVFKNSPKYRYMQPYMFSGGLFTFEYFNPKYEGTTNLPWFDKYPLVLSLGPVITDEGVRNIGFNLHLLPPKIRIIVVCQVFEIYKNLYRYQIFFKRDRPVAIRYQVIVRALRKFGVDFCIRMYIPSRQRQIVCFPYEDWYKAIFIPSRGYDSIKAQKLISLWTKHVRKNGYSISPTVDWQSKV